MVEGFIGYRSVLLRVQLQME